jgi:3-deoxy-7-phosphoheptulonate synthase
VTKQGLSAIVQTEGNDACHVILRGGKSGTNFDTEAVKKTAIELQKVKLAPVVMVDCSHGNSSKDHKRQPIVAKSIVSEKKLCVFKFYQHVYSLINWLNLLYLAITLSVL